MNSPVTGLRLAGTLFALIALVHVWRLVRGFDVIIGNHHIPASASVVGAIIAGALSLWMWKLSSNGRR